MKGFPNQVAELPKLSNAVKCIARLTDRGEQARDDGILGEELVRAGIAGTGHTPMPIEKYLRLQHTKSKSNQSFRTTARGLRELFRLLEFIDDSGSDISVTETGRQAASFADQPISPEGLAFWRRAVLDMTHSGGDPTESHPYQVLLRLVARRPGITRAKCALALEAKDDSQAELDRIAQLASRPEPEIIRQLGITKSNWDNAKKVLPKFAEQLGDVIRTGDSYTMADAPGRADAGPTGQRGAVAVRAPRTSRQVTPETIGRAATAGDFDEFAAGPEIDATAAAEAIRSRRNRLRRHNLLVQKLATRLAAAGTQLYENPFDLLGLIRNVGILAEVKSLDGTQADERDRVLEALAQLLYYQAFLLPPAAGQASVRMVACFERPITNDHIRWLNQQNIAVIWEEGSGFGGDALAANFLGRYLEELR